MKNSSDLQSLLAPLVAIPSTFPDEKSMGEYILNYLHSIGFRTETQSISPGRTNIFAAKGHGKNAVLFYGHIDTVAVGDRTMWRTDPHILSQKGDRLYGLGAYDMKGGICAFLQACENSDSYIKILLAVDEENISEGAWAAINEKKQFFHDVSLIVSAEPNFGLGLNSITTGRTGRCVFDVRFTGKPVHIANYKTGTDAFEMLGKFVTKLYQTRNTLFPGTQTVLQVRKISGESIGMSVCGTASVEVEVLLDAKTSIADARQALIRMGASRVTLKKRRTPYLTGYDFEQFLNKNLIADIIKKQTGKKMFICTRTSVGDDNVLATMGIPVITWGPDGGNAHAPNEYVSLDSLQTLTEMYKTLLYQLVNHY